MGLAERRRIQELQTTTLPERSREIAEIFGQAVPYEVDWESFQSDDEALKFLDNTACHRINMALRTIAIDELGREALRDGLKRIRLSNATDPATRQARFEGGTLALHAPWALGTQGMFSDGAIRELLLSRL